MVTKGEREGEEGYNQEFEISNYINTKYKTDILQHWKSTSIKKKSN